MEKRFIVFMVLSVAIMAAYITVQATFFRKPEPEAVAKKADQDPVKDKAGADKGAEKKVDPATKKETPSSEIPPEAPKTDENPEATPKSPEEQPAAAKAEPEQRVTLGSVEPGGPYRILVTLNNRGAAIERIELSSLRYRDLDDFTGYFGHLALLDQPQGAGCLVNVVGAGTPAALAVEKSDPKLIGIQVGDIIDGFDGQPVKREIDLRDIQSRTRSGQTVTINVTRGTAKLVFDVATIRRPLEVIRPEFGRMPDGATGPQDPLSCLLTLSSARGLLGAKTEVETDPLRDATWKVKTITTGKSPVIEMSYELSTDEAKSLGLAGAVEVIKRYSVDKITDEAELNDPTAMAYHLDCEVELRNLTSEAQEVAFQMDGPNGLPYEGWWYSTKISPHWGSAGARDIVWKRHEDYRDFRSCPSIYAYAVKNPLKPMQSLLGDDQGTQLDYVGVDAQYFAAVLIPDVAQDPSKSTFRKAFSKAVSDVALIPKVDQKRTNTSFQVTSEPKLLPPEGSYKQTLRLFAGPKVPGLMAKYDLEDVIEYGWFRAVSIPLSWLLHTLYNNVLFNYGLAIIALTVIVRGCMYPFSRQAAKNAQIMQELSPELKKLTEKYKNDMQKRSEAQSELFKKYNYHPLSGCLPMFLQLPIFLGLYRSLAVDIELRQAALIPGLQWASNLAGPDMLFYWKPYLPLFLAGEASGWLGPYFNLLPLISVAFLQVHQRLFTPPATDEQTKMTQDMMKYMTLFMGVLFFKVPAGLCIYFITSSLWSVCERLMLPKPKPPGTMEVAEKKPVTKPGTNGAEGNKSERKKNRK